MRSSSKNGMLRLPPFQQGGLDSLCGLYSIIKRLPRTSCTTVNATYQRKHVLLPAQTYFLSNELQDITQYDT